MEVNCSFVCLPLLLDGWVIFRRADIVSSVAAVGLVIIIICHRRRRCRQSAKPIPAVVKKADARLSTHKHKKSRTLAKIAQNLVYSQLE